MNKTVLVIGLVVVIGFGVSALLFRPHWTSQTSKARESAPIGDQKSSITPNMTTTPTMKSKTYNATPPMTIDVSKTYKAVIVTSKGTMQLTFFAKDTPITVNTI